LARRGLCSVLGCGLVVGWGGWVGVGGCLGWVCVLCAWGAGALFIFFWVVFLWGGGVWGGGVGGECVVGLVWGQVWVCRRTEWV